MKLPDKKKTKKQKMKKRPITKPKKEKVLVVAQEFKFARLLSGNEKKTRDRVLKTFKKWLLNCFEKGYEFKENDFIRVWKGLFYAVWMSDKPLVQEDLCESISEILDLFPANQVQYAVMMMKAGFKVLATEWYGIDQHRMDKFLMLVRRYLRGSFRCLKRCKWSIESCKLFADMLCTEDGLLAIKTPQYARNATSMVLHIIDCYLEELSKISRGQIPDESLTALMYPFSQQVCLGDGVICITSRRLLTALMKQSDLGLEYDSVTRVWQKMGCPPGGPEALQAESDDEEDQELEDMGVEDMENGEQPLDPRAGRVDVTLEPLPVPSRLLAAQIRGLMSASASRAFKRAKLCLERFEELSRDSYPLKVLAPDAEGLEPALDAAEPMKAASRLSKLEKTLVTSSDELALRGLSRKHRKRLLARTRAGLSIVEDADDNADSTNGDWQVEATKKNKDSNTNKENKSKKKNRKRKHQKENGEEENNKKTKINEINQENSKNKKKESKISEKKTEVNKVKQKSPQNNVNKTKNVKDKGKKEKLANGPSKQGVSVTNTENKKNNKENKQENKETQEKKQTDKQPKFVVTKVKNYQKQVNQKKESPKNMKKENQNKQMMMDTPKKVKFVLKNNCMQGTIDYYKSVRQSPNIPFDSTKKPSKTNLKPSTPSPINPFFKKKLKMKK